MRLSAVAERITDSARDLGSPFELRMKSVGTRSMPVQAGEAIYSAAVQAMVNSLQHAGETGVTRWISVRAVNPGGMEVVVGDTGVGFSTAGGPSERLGVRVSIVERVANAGGRATLKSAPGEGTVVTIRWPYAQPASSGGTK